MAHSLRLVLYEPEIPPNTGNAARLCAATQTELHLVEPLGFSIDDKHLRRAGLDYWPHVNVTVWPSWLAFCHGRDQSARLVASSARAGERYCDFAYSAGDYLVLGPETRGLPPAVIEAAHGLVRIPIWGQVRSLNLSTAAGVLLYEALRQTGGMTDGPGGS